VPLSNYSLTHSPTHPRRSNDQLNLCTAKTFSKEVKNVRRGRSSCLVLCCLLQIKVQADSLHKLSITEYDDNYTAHMESELTEDTITAVGKISYSIKADEVM